MRTILKLAMAASFTLVAAGHAVAQASRSIWDKVAETGVLTVGAMSANPLGSWREMGQGPYRGYNIGIGEALAQALTQAMGRPVRTEFVETTWGTVVLDLQAGKMDIWTGMSETEERKRALDMAGPMYELAHCYVNRRGLTGLTSWDDYSKPAIRIASVTGTSDEKAVRELSPNATHLTFRQAPEAILAVQSGRADAFGTSVLTCLRILKENPAFGEIVFPTPVRSLPSSAGMRRDGDGRFHRFVQDWATRARGDGTTTRILSESITQAGLDPGQLPSGFRF
jgi:polar amino acid transport system substrate-binding protein